MSSSFTLSTESESERVAREVIRSLPAARVFALHGDLGAGKTTLIKGFCSALGVNDQASSPSFAIVNEYRSASGEPVYHFDLYRLNDATELEGIGFMEYVDSGHYCFIEWPELAEGLLPEEVVHLRIAVKADGARVVEVVR